MACRFAIAIPCILIPISLGYAYYRYKYNYFERCGIPHLKCNTALTRTNHKHHVRHVYNIFKTLTPIAGLYLNETPTIVILELELIKRVLINDFSNFHDRFNEKPNHKDLLHTFDNIEWQAARRKLGPCFWSAKMDYIFPSVIKAAEASIEEISNILERSTKSLDLQIFCTNYAINALLSCVFGVELNQNKTDESTKVLRTLLVELLMNEYETRYLMNSVMTNICWRRCTRHAQLAKPELGAQLDSAVRALVKERRALKVKRNDILQIFVDMLDDVGDDSTAINSKESAMQLFTKTLYTLLTGFVKTAKTLTHCLHELARNNEIQNILRFDIERVMKNYEQKFSYEAMGHMHYLDQVVAETLRKYPLSEVLIRRTVQNYRVPDTAYTIERNTCVLVPVYAIHHDSSIYPKPEQFDPSRFDAAVVMARHACAYLSFDDGPRNCMGKRLSKMLIKVAVFMLLQSYVIACEYEGSENLALDGEKTKNNQSKIVVEIEKINLVKDGK
ncbi:probable cytochrome P450 6a13 [Eurosta solidaginis]|uniref:probable cytochrome P450 6a13 n=1 Tax=Eurosta solidaginis TaxID=178769 RepID=UPI003530E416